MSAAPAQLPGAVEIVRRFPGNAEAAHQARELACAALGAGHPRRDDADLVVTELVANAVAHSLSGWLAGGTVTVRIRLAGELVEIRVRDMGSVLRPLAGADPAGWAEGGRGLVLVDHLADEWGHQDDGAGRVTWCRLTVHPPAVPVAHEALCSTRGRKARDDG